LAFMSRKDADGPHLGVRWGEGQVFGVVRKDHGRRLSSSLLCVLFWAIWALS
jgi:hypothetical protein